MYVSPINMIIDDFQTEVVKEGENYICRAVQKVGVDVDKDELVKALMYDRNQYEKGYEDGLKANKWIPCSERLPEEEGQYLVTLDFSWGKEIEMGDWFNGEWVNPNSHVTVAWMPLPQPYKAESEDKE